MGEVGAEGMRGRIATFLSGVIGGVSREHPKPSLAALKDFITVKLEIVPTSDGNGHYKYVGYTDERAHKALEKILSSAPAFTGKVTNPSVVAFEKELLKYLQKQSCFSENQIPPNIFRKSYRDNQVIAFASTHLIDEGDSHAEYLCKLYLDKCSKSPKIDMGLLDRNYSGIFLFIVLEDFHADGEMHGNITFSDNLSFDFGDLTEISILKRKYKITRVNPIGKPTISKSSIGNEIRARYTSAAQDGNKYYDRLDSFQKNVILDILNLTLGNLYPNIVSMNEEIGKNFGSGSLFRTVLDVEKGAIFAYQAAHGRFWIFAFCPVELKVPLADATLRKQIVEHYEREVERLA